MAESARTGGWQRILGLTWDAALTDASSRCGERTAFLFEGPNWTSALTYAEWRRVSATAAAGLAALGVGPGDRVAALGSGGPLWPILQTACSRLQAVIVPINHRYRHDELVHVMRLARPTVTVAAERVHRTATLDGLRRAASDAEVAPHFVSVGHADVELAPTNGAPAPVGEVSSWAQLLALGAASPTPPPAADAGAGVLLQFTSGTTAFPKAALLANGATLGTALQLGLRMGLTPEDRFYSTQPFYHVGGSVATTLIPLTIGCTVVVPERYTPEETFRLVCKHRCTARTGQAAMYWTELAHPDFDPATFATVEKGWAGGTPELRRLIVERMGIPHLTTVYGMTETGATTTVPPYDAPADVRISTCGPALDGLEVAIAVGDEKVTTPGVRGEVCVRGWSLMLGYLGDEAATAAAIDAEGWLHSGDLGVLDVDGNLTIVDRLKDMIKPGGENVSPAEVERVLETIPDVVQAAVVGMPDERLGEVPVAFVELRPDSRVDEEAILEVCRAEMASFKVPRRVVLVDEWPLTGSGKIQKHVLREQLGAPTATLTAGSG